MCMRRRSIIRAAWTCTRALALVAVFPACAVPAARRAEGTVETRTPPVLSRPVEGLNPRRTLFPGITAGRGDYVSYAIYFWPDPATADGLPYVARDGQKNATLIAMGDAPRLRVFLETTTELGRAWQRTRDGRYARRAGEWLRTWFLDPSTRMNPNLAFSQIRPGSTTVGHGGGIIDLANLPPMLDAIEPLRESDALTAAEWAGIDAWMRAYLEWLRTSPQGAFERNNTNNHFPYLMGQVARIAMFLGEVNLARSTLDEAFARLDDHIAPDGSQPHEVKRVKGFEYSVYSFEAWQRLAAMGARLGRDDATRETAKGASLAKAYRYLEQFTGPGGKPWPQTGKPFPAAALGRLVQPADDGSPPPETPTAAGRPGPAPRSW